MVGWTLLLKLSALSILTTREKYKLSNAFNKGWIETKGYAKTKGVVLGAYGDMCLVLGRPHVIIEHRKNKGVTNPYVITIEGVTLDEAHTLLTMFHFVTSTSPDNFDVRYSYINYPDMVLVVAKFADYKHAEDVAKHVVVLEHLRPSSVKGSVQEAIDAIIKKYARHGSPQGEILATLSIRQVYEELGTSDSAQKKLSTALKNVHII